MTWYYAAAGKQVGPFSEADFQALVNAGTITAATLVWHDGLSGWVPYGSVAPAAPAVPVVTADDLTEGTCCECGKRFPLSEMVTYEGATVCAACKPVFFQRVQEGAALPGHMVYGGFWLRFGAKFIDGMIMGAVNVLLTLAVPLLLVQAVATSGPPSLARVVGTQVLLMGLQLLIGGVYYVGFLGRYGATPGKMACRLRVVRSDGSRLTYGRAVGRYFGDMLSGLTLGIGYIIAAFDDEKRALHDRICDTRVIVPQN